MNLQTMTLEAWKKNPIRDVRLIKSEPAASVEKGADGKIRVVISTETRDRDNDTIAVDGWDLEAYQTNPVVLFAHDHHILNVAISPITRREGNALVGYPQFVPREINPFAGTVEDMVRGGYLRAASVGFNPSSWVIDEEAHGWNFQTQQLLEYSFVPVGSNPDALVSQAKSLRVDRGAYQEWKESILGKSGTPNDQGISRDSILAAINRIKGKAKKTAPDPREVMAERVKRATERVVTKLTGRVF